VNAPLTIETARTIPFGSLDVAVNGGRGVKRESHLGTRWIKGGAVGLDRKDATARDPEDG